MNVVVGPPYRLFGPLIRLRAVSPPHSLFFGVPLSGVLTDGCISNTYTLGVIKEKKKKKDSELFAGGIERILIQRNRTTKKLLEHSYLHNFIINDII